MLCVVATPATNSSGSSTTCDIWVTGARRHGTTVVDGSAARAPPRVERCTWARHPNAGEYAAIADDGGGGLQWAIWQIVAVSVGGGLALVVLFALCVLACCLVNG